MHESQTCIIVSHFYEKIQSMTNLHCSSIFCMKLKMSFRHFSGEREIMLQFMAYIGRGSLRWKLKENNEWTVLTPKSNSLSLPISKANFTHQTLNPPENSTSVSKPFLHNMHSPKRKSSKFALFCQITGSICNRFPHPLIFHNSSPVCENASRADVLFSVLFTNLSIICLLFRTPSISLSFTILFFLIGQIFHNLFRLCQGGRDYGSFAPGHYLLCLLLTSQWGWWLSWWGLEEKFENLMFLHGCGLGMMLLTKPPQWKFNLTDAAMFDWLLRRTTTKFRYFSI